MRARALLALLAAHAAAADLLDDVDGAPPAMVAASALLPLPPLLLLPVRLSAAPTPPALRPFSTLRVRCRSRFREALHLLPPEPHPTAARPPPEVRVVEV